MSLTDEKIFWKLIIFQVLFCDKLGTIQYNPSIPTNYKASDSCVAMMTKTIKSWLRRFIKASRQIS